MSEITIGPQLAPELAGLMGAEWDARVAADITTQRALMLIRLGSLVARKRIGYVEQLRSENHDICRDALNMMALDLDSGTLLEAQKLWGFAPPVEHSENR